MFLNIWITAFIGEVLNDQFDMNIQDEWQSRCGLKPGKIMTSHWIAQVVIINYKVIFYLCKLLMAVTTDDYILDLLGQKNKFPNILHFLKVLTATTAFRITAVAVKIKWYHDVSLHTYSINKTYIFHTCWLSILNTLQKMNESQCSNAKPSLIIPALNHLLLLLLYSSHWASLFIDVTLTLKDFPGDHR